MRDNYTKNTKGCIYHLCLAVCGKDRPETIMGWCGLDGRASHTEPEIFILLDEEYRGKGYIVLHQSNPHLMISPRLIEHVHVEQYQYMLCDLILGLDLI